MEQLDLVISRQDANDWAGSVGALAALLDELEASPEFAHQNAPLVEIVCSTISTWVWSSSNGRGTRGGATAPAFERG
jgi:hypothetical protein